jgi:NAD(P)-dependent dehydrogenase (short-subunit alcohol dehydrogenase family)
MDMEIRGKRVLITGGSKGIGFHCGMAFAAEGCDIILASRDGAALEQAAGQIRGRHNVHVGIHAGDLSKPADRVALHAAHPDIDILVNNAGAIPGGTVHDIALDRWIEAWNLKVFGYIHLTQLYLPAMEKRQDGVIVNIIGMAGRAPRADYVCGASGNASRAPRRNSAMRAAGRRCWRGCRSAAPASRRRSRSLRCSAPARAAGISRARRSTWMRARNSAVEPGIPPPPAEGWAGQDRALPWNSSSRTRSAR